VTPAANNEDWGEFHLLLERARAGEATAREELFARSRPFLVSAAEQELRAWLRVKQDPSDLVQVSLLDAHRAFAAFEGKDTAQWQAFLRRILSRNAADAARHFGAAKRYAGAELALYPASSDASGRGHLEPSAGGATPSGEAVQRERAERLRDALARLPPDHQEVIRLRNLEQLPFEEVAERLGRSRPAAQMLWMRALKSLEIFLQPDTTSTLGPPR